jgi:ABC-type histidine transport system ATPase subunit
MRLVLSGCTRFIRILRLTLCEIFDEAAYARYLQRVGLEASRQSYAGFLEEKHQARSPAARCC